MNSTLKALPILLPVQNIDKTKWAVVSCDQFTSQKSYWEKLDKTVDGAPSTLRLIFPEVYLNDGDSNPCIEKINETMRDYLSRGCFEQLENSFILVERDTSYGKKRLGIMASVDLEDFVYEGAVKSPIRPTEGVVAERIPPRLKIRKNAPIELPHILLLVDDREKTVIESFYANREAYEKLYDFELNMNGGHLRGYKLPESEVTAAFGRLSDEKLQKEKYGAATNFIFAVGDGNHSLATAKAHWENVKKTLSGKELENHPARYALCEIENLHCDGIVFEPIHRCVFGAKSDFTAFLKEKLEGEGKLRVVFNGVAAEISVPSSTPEAISAVENAIAEYTKTHVGASVDYIHGEQNLLEVAKDKNAAAAVMPSLDKNELFDFVLKRGALCKKSFSMGEAEEKRYYYEAKRI